MLHFNDKFVKFFSSFHFPFWELSSSNFYRWFLQPPKNGRKWSPTAWWTSCQEPSPRPPKSRNPARVREKKISTEFFGGEIKTNPKCIKNTEMDGKSGKKTNCFFRSLSPENQPRNVNRKEENWINTQIRSQNWSYTTCLFIYIFTSIVWPGDQSQLIERIAYCMVLKGSKDECILFDSNDSHILYDLHGH